MSANTRNRFRMDLECDLEGQTSDFVIAFAECLNYLEIDSLEDRVDMLMGAVDTVTKAIPSEKSSGTALGAVLASFPSGKRLLEAANLHFGRKGVPP